MVLQQVGATYIRHNGAAANGSSRVDSVVLQQVAATVLQQVEATTQMQRRTGNVQVKATKGMRCMALQQVDATEIIQWSCNKWN